MTLRLKKIILSLLLINVFWLFVYVSRLPVLGFFNLPALFVSGEICWLLEIKGNSWIELSTILVMGLMYWGGVIAFLTCIGGFSPRHWWRSLCFAVCHLALCTAIFIYLPIFALMNCKWFQKKISAAEEYAAAHPLDSEAFKQLVKFTKSNNSEVRMDAIEALGSLGLGNQSLRKKIVPFLISAFELDEDYTVRQEAVFRLGDLAGPDTIAAVPVLERALDNGWSSFAASALGNYGPLADSAVGELKASLAAIYMQKDNEIAADFADALGKIGDASAVDVLSRCLQSPSSNTRFSALKALIKLKQDNPEMRKALNEFRTSSPDQYENMSGELNAIARERAAKAGDNLPSTNSPDHGK